MGTVVLGRVLELWLLGPDVVVEPGEKLADTRAATREREKKRIVLLLPSMGKNIEIGKINDLCSCRHGQKEVKEAGRLF